MTAKQLAQESGYEWAHAIELLQCLYYVPVLIALRYVFTWATVKVQGKSLREQFPDQKTYESKLEKQIDFNLKAFIFAAIALYGYLIMKEADFFPTYFGGSGDAAKVFDNYPLVSNRPAGWKSYYVMNLAIFSEILISMLMAHPREDLGEMMFHHILTIALIVFSYEMNVTNIGMLVMFTANVFDAFMCWTRGCLSYTPKWFHNIAYLILVSSHGYLRLYCYYFIVRVGFEVDAPLNGSPFPVKYMAYGLACLGGLFVMWHYFILRVGYVALRYGKIDDNHGEQHQKKD